MKYRYPVEISKRLKSARPGRKGNADGEWDIIIDDLDCVVFIELYCVPASTVTRASLGTELLSTIVV